MSKNFELMQRAGRLLEIEIPPAMEPAAPGTASAIAPALQPTIAPAFTSPLEPLGRKKWMAGRAAGWTHDQIAREESRRLVQQIFMSQTQDPPRVVVFAGIDHGNGCSRMCAHVAETLREVLRGSICLVEANFRSPSSVRRHGKSSRVGLIDALLGEGPIRSFATLVRNDNCYLLSSGSITANSPNVLNSDRLKSRFRDLRNEFDYAVVDAPPLTRYSDAITLAKAADGVVLVLEANTTRRDAAIRASEHLRAARIRILGAVLNKRTFPIPEPLYQRL